MLVGVETKLIDNSPSTVGGNSDFIPAIITFADKGPVNKPYFCSSVSELMEIFGDAVLKRKQYGLFAAYEYFKQGSACWIVRAGADKPGFAEADINARDGKPLLKIVYKNSGEFGNTLRASFQDINPINFDGVVTMQVLLEMKNPLTPDEWAASETTPYPEYVPVPGKNRFNVDFASQKIYTAVDAADQVNNFGEYIYDAATDTCIKQVNEVVFGNETEDFMFVFERAPFSSTLVIENLKATVSFSGGSNAIETAWAPIFNLDGYKKYDAARALFKTETENYTMAKNEYVQLPVNVQKYVRDNNILVIGGLTLAGMKDVVYGDKLVDFGKTINTDTSVGSVAYAILYPMLKDITVTDDATADVTNNIGETVTVTIGDIRKYAMPVGGDVNTYNYYLTADEDKFLLRELTKKDCPKDATTATATPIAGTEQIYNVVVQFANAAETLADIISKMDNIKKDSANQAFKVSSVSPGTWGNDFAVSIDYNASQAEIYFTVYKNVGGELVEVENGMSAIDKADRLVFKNIAIEIVTPVETTIPGTTPVNDYDPTTGSVSPMKFMGGADMFTEADYNNDAKLAPYIAGSVGHQTGVWALENFDAYAYGAMAAPYFSQFGMVSGEMVSLAEKRRDFHVVVDTPDVMPQAVINWFAAGNHNSKFESIYYPWVVKLDSYTKKLTPIPASGSVLQSMAITRANARICDVPAGSIRGVIYDAVAISKDIKLSQAMRDRLYGMAINPIIKGLTEGIHIMGQRTTYSKTSPMQKVGTMLMIEKIVRDLSIAGKSYLMELSIPNLWSRIQGDFQAYLNTYVTGDCLESATAVVNSEINPPIVLAQSKLNALVSIKPNPYVENLIIPISVQ